MSLSAITDFPSLYAEYVSTSLLQKWFYWSIVKFTAFIYPYLLDLRFDSSKHFWKALVIIIPFLSFKGINHEYLL